MGCFLLEPWCCAEPVLAELSLIGGKCAMPTLRLFFSIEKYFCKHTIVSLLKYRCTAAIEIPQKRSISHGTCAPNPCNVQQEKEENILPVQASNTNSTLKSAIFVVASDVSIGLGDAVRHWFMKDAYEL